MSLPRLIAASAVCLLAACTDTTPPTTPTPYTPPTPALHVTGRLVDFHTSQGVSGVAMQWRDTAPGGSQFPSVRSVSDSTGSFQVDLPVAARFIVQFEAGGNASAIVIVPGKRLDTDLLVNAGPCAARYGTVIDAATRQPVAGAVVTRAGSARTDAAGRYLIDIGCETRDWGYGTTIISVQHPDYAGTFEFDGRREHTNASGARRVDFELQPLPTSAR
jgi:hypothetical protein